MMTLQFAACPSAALLLLFFSLLAKGQTTPVGSNDLASKQNSVARQGTDKPMPTAARCRAEILSLKNQPSSYFEHLPKQRLQYLYDLAGDCGDTTIAGLSDEELNDNFHVYTIIEMILSSPAGPATETTNQRNSSQVNPSHMRRCQDEILPLKGQPRVYFEGLPKPRLKYLYGVAAACVHVDTRLAGITLQEMSDIDGVYALIGLVLTELVPESQRIPERATTQAESPCHSLIVKLGEAATRFLSNKSPKSPETVESVEQRYAERQQLIDCVWQTPDELSVEDWQNAVFLSGELTKQFDDAYTASQADALNGVFHDTYQMLKANDQQWLNDYNDLVHKYNALVRDYNSQRDLLIRLSATPLVLPPPPTFVHCETFVSGNIGTIDCY